MASAQDHPVGAPLEGPEEEDGIDPAGAGHPDDLHVGGIGKPVCPGEIRPRVGAPVAAEGHDGGNKSRRFVHLHIASTSAMI